MHESMKKPFLCSRKPQKKQKRLEKDIRVGWGYRDKQVQAALAAPTQVTSDQNSVEIARFLHYFFVFMTLFYIVLRS